MNLDDDLLQAFVDGALNHLIGEGGIDLHTNHTKLVSSLHLIEIGLPKS